MVTSTAKAACWPPTAASMSANGKPTAATAKAERPGPMATGSRASSLKTKKTVTVGNSHTGRFQWTDGSYFEGAFKKGEYDGFGVYKWNKDKIYEGDWKEGKMHGRGKLSYTNGDCYEGQFYKGKKHGKGIFKWAQQGTYYDGEWNNNQPHGVGFVGKDNQSKRKAMYEDGKHIMWLDQE